MNTVIENNSDSENVTKQCSLTTRAGFLFKELCTRASLRFYTQGTNVVNFMYIQI